jgi:hypothetical protein
MARLEGLKALKLSELENFLTIMYYGQIGVFYDPKFLPICEFYGPKTLHSGWNQLMLKENKASILCIRGVWLKMFEILGPYNSQFWRILGP